ncbi:MAG TPA: tetratricopeptide repeat protein [Candidatus Binatia bacterium]|jgi:Tfp pilus assembly protein PilF|nr:tetratricopeptide repeat protein [Candidatus Binatia bacterium]
MAHSRKRRDHRQTKPRTLTPQPSAPLPSSAPERSTIAIVCVLALLVTVTVAAYWPVLRHEFFVEWDDPDYVTANPHVQQGLTAQSIAWAFRATDFANWFPLTWLSHMLDCQFFSLNPLGHHLTSLILHVFNSLLLYLWLRRMAGAVWPGCAVAGLFALHPLHVESVAWVAERKDVLSTFFGMLALLAYAKYVTSGGRRVTRERTSDEGQVSRGNVALCTSHAPLQVSRPALWYFLALVFFALGLMAKPMLVSLPVVLLLLDYWPLRRLPAFHGSAVTVAHSPTQPATPSPKIPLSLGPLIREKVPFFTLAAASSIVTFMVQSKGGAVAAIATVPLPARLGNVPVAYTGYLAKTFFPVGLSPLYPFDFHLPAWRVAGSVVLLSLVTVTAVRWRRPLPYLFTGWFWYLFTLLPVIGLVQVGGQAMADRYTYVPLIGIFIIVVWGTAGLARRLGVASRRGHGLLALSTGAAVLAICLAAATRLYLGSWQNSFTLFSRALKVNEANDTAHFNLGLWLATRDGKLREAAEHFRRAASLNPHHAPSRYSLGLCLAQLGDPAQAARLYREALAVAPGYGPAHHNLAILLEQNGQREEALEHYEAALQANPEDLKVRQNLSNAHNNFGAALQQQGKLGEAEAQFQAATRVNPTNTLAHANLAIVLYQEARYPEAWQAVNACRQHGGSVSESLLTNLMQRMPSPDRLGSK